MSSRLRARRLENEWGLLALLAEENPGILEIVRWERRPGEDLFHVVLRDTPGFTGKPPALVAMDSHAVTLRYPEYFPGVPIEAFLVNPVFHPNVHPENGFVCLWNRFSVGDTIFEALRQLQRVITWQVSNGHAEHLMQPEAVGWTPDNSLALPRPMRIPAGYQIARTWKKGPPGSWRRRLS